ncbi:COBRA-like protein [Tanacetum coccineum]
MLFSRCMRHDRGGEEVASAISHAFTELNTCNVALLEAADESWEETFQQYRRVLPLEWTLSWTYAEKEVMWSMMGAQTTEQGDCSRYKSARPHCCKKIWEHLAPLDAKITLLTLEIV